MCTRVGWRIRTLSAVLLVVALTVVGVAIGLVVHGPVGALLGATPGALAAVVAGFVPALRDNARARRAQLDAARQAWEAVGEPHPGRSADDSGPAALLRPDLGIVNFIGRQTELDELRAWCDRDSARSVRVITGTGGVGKTRLALRIADEWAAAGGAWRLVAAGKEGSALGAARGVTSGRVLLVVDYAETRADIQALLEATLTDPGPTRVLLLARSLGEWWERLTEQSPPAVARLLTETGPMHLTPPLADDKSDEALAAEAVPYFARALRIDPPASVEFEFLPERVPVLVLHAAALAAVLRSTTGSEMPLRVLVATGVLGEVLEHEARYWRRTAIAAELTGDGQVLKPVVAVAALLGAADIDEAAELVPRVPDLEKKELDERRRWARWLYSLYPAGAGGRLGPLQPDLLAETHVTVQLTKDPALARNCLKDLPDGQAEHAMTVLAQAWVHHPNVRHLIAAALSADLRSLAVPAARAAIQTRAELGDVLADALADAPAPLETLMSVAESLPYPSVVLARANLAITSRVRQALPPGSEPQTVAKWADRTGTMLAAVGHPAQALPVTQEAVTIYRELALTEPDQYRPDLARALDNLGVWLWELGRPAQALPVTQEAVTIYQELALTEPDQYRPDLARALDNLGVWFSELGHPAQALPVTQEAVALRREFEAARPGPPHPDLARALDNLGVRFSELGQPAEALPVTQEAVSIYRDLAAASPDRYRPDLARALDNLGVRFSELGQPVEALPVTQEAVDIRRELAAVSPDRYRPDFASSLDHAGVRFWALDRPAEALPRAEEAVGIYRVLAATDPDRYRPGYARSLSNLGVWLRALGIPLEALAVTQEAVAIRRDLAAGSPGRYGAELAQSLSNLGVVYSALGRLDDALPATLEAASAYREQAEDNRARYRSELATTLDSLADVLSRLDRNEEAADIRAEARAVREST